MRFTTVMAAAVLCAGCSLTQPAIESSPADEAATTIERTPTGEAPSIGGVHPAAAQFLGDARNWRKLGDDARAAASLERAIRLDPRHPQPWLELAALRRDGGDIDQAENLALKARSLAPRDSAWYAEAEALLVEIAQTPR